MSPLRRPRVLFSSAWIDSLCCRWLGFPGSPRNEEQIACHVCCAAPPYEGRGLKPGPHAQRASGGPHCCTTRDPLCERASRRCGALSLCIRSPTHPREFPVRTDAWFMYGPGMVVAFRSGEVRPTGRSNETTFVCKGVCARRFARVHRGRDAGGRAAENSQGGDPAFAVGNDGDQRNGAEGRGADGVRRDQRQG